MRARTQEPRRSGSWDRNPVPFLGPKSEAPNYRGSHFRSHFRDRNPVPKTAPHTLSKTRPRGRSGGPSVHSPSISSRAGPRSHVTSVPGSRCIAASLASISGSLSVPLGHGESEIGFSGTGSHRRCGAAVDAYTKLSTGKFDGPRTQWRCCWGSTHGPRSRMCFAASGIMLHVPHASVSPTEFRSSVVHGSLMSYSCHLACQSACVRPGTPPQIPRAILEGRRSGRGWTPNAGSGFCARHGSLASS